MATHVLRRLLAAGRVVAQALRRRLLAATRPAAAPPLTGAVADLARTKPEFLAENALLRQQLLILRRQVKRPRCTQADRVLLVLVAGRLRTWRHALLLVQPDTLLRWHRQLFR
jgi:putative transposase